MDHAKGFGQGKAGVKERLRRRFSRSSYVAGDGVAAFKCSVRSCSGDAPDCITFVADDSVARCGQIENISKTPSCYVARSTFNRQGAQASAADGKAAGRLNSCLDPNNLDRCPARSFSLAGQEAERSVVLAKTRNLTWSDRPPRSNPPLSRSRRHR